MVEVKHTEPQTHMAGANLCQILEDILEGWDFWQVNPHDREPPRHAISQARAALSATAQNSQDGNRPLPYDRDSLGRFVREAWVRWAETQPDPKPSWLVPYDGLSEPDKEADRQIGEALARWTLIGDAARLSQVEEHLRNIEATADAISSPQRMSIIRKQALQALALLSQTPPPAEKPASPPTREEGGRDDA